MKIQPNELAEFIFIYIEEYRRVFHRFTTPPPDGAGYPPLHISPFLTSNSFDVYLANDGVIISEIADEPPNWFIAGGPAIKVDTEPTKTPIGICQILKDNNLENRSIGIYRIVPQKHISHRVWRGRIKNLFYEHVYQNDRLKITLNLRVITNKLRGLIEDLTFGADEIFPPPDFPSDKSNFGQPDIIENLGFFPADLNNKRFFKYLEIYQHIDKAAWDKRIVSLRVKSDIRRDYAKKLSRPEQLTGGYLSFGHTEHWVENFFNRLEILRTALDEFKKVLTFKSHETEDVFHTLLEQYPVLLDVYGHCKSKPRFKYPQGELSPNGKQYVEPDFIVIYQSTSYKLIELERASKKIATRKGHPTSEAGQAAFQIAEWLTYIKEYYSELKTVYPGIHQKCTTCLIISRSTESSFQNIEDINGYKNMLYSHYKIDEILTYDDLYEKACAAYTTLTGLLPDSRQRQT
ncbi:Shedu anti-phage system protein SduA domain-containing protein [Legionella sp. 29fVS95]|uniref:Shedu anti-phage system protein SduA domain-containing protein n=1 Tax=Legionella sp. 29fVS95 TaxID=3402813 RepID=UPI003AF9A66E